MDPHPSFREDRPKKRPSLDEQLDGTMFDVPADEPETAPDPTPDPTPADPSWLTTPNSKLEWDFKRYHEAHPEVYAALEQAALAWAQSGASRIAIKRLVENIRYSRLSVEQRAHEHLPFKLNNNHAPLYARLLIARHPNLADVIELRARTEPGASTDDDRATLAIFDPPRRCAKCQASEPPKGELLCLDCAYDAFADDDPIPQRGEGAA